MTLGLFDAIDDAAAFADTIAELHDAEPLVDLDPDDDSEDDAPVVTLIVLADGRTISVNEKGHWRDEAGRKIIPIRGARAWRLGEQDGIVCPDCSSPARYASGVWRCPNGSRSHKFCGGLTVPKVRRPKNTVKWICTEYRCGHEWKTHASDGTPERCPECNQPTVRFVKRTSR